MKVFAIVLLLCNVVLDGSCVFGLIKQECKVI